MIRKLFCSLFFWVLLAPSVSAQTIQWLVKPNYDTISHLSNSVFKCKTNGRVQPINTKGEELLTSLADSVTNYSENLALVLEKTGDELQIRGIINDYGEFTQVEGAFFVNKYSYFSEGLVSVMDLSGKAGYLDDKGKLAIPCQYRIARPFIKGWASVEPARRKKQTIYIDRQCNTLKISGFHNGKIIMGSSFNSSGEALVAYYGNDNVVINTQGKVDRKYDRKMGITPIRPYDFAFDESGKDGFPNAVPEISLDTEPSPFSFGQLVGYKKDDYIVAPPQFSQAGHFANGCAIVCQNGKYGIVRLVEGVFSGAFDGGDLLVAAGKEAPTYTYSLAIPESLNPNALQVLFDIGDGNMQSVNLQDNKFEFTPFVDHEADVCVMRMQVKSEGLLLWADSLEKSITNVSLDISLPETISERANEHDEQRIHSVITNNSDSPIFVSAYFSAKFGKESKNSVASKVYSSAKIAPKAQKEFYVDLKVLEPESVKVFMSVKANQKQYGVKSSTIELKPYY